MTLVSSIRTSLSKVGRMFADGVVEYRSLTSTPNASPRTYSAWATLLYARCCEFGESQQQDQTSGVWYRVETCDLRVPYESGVSLTIRDQIRQGPTAAEVSTSNVVWSVREQGQSSVDAVSVYHLSRKTPMLSDARQGGV